MARRLHQLGKPCELLYFARSRKSAAFMDEVQALGIAVHWHFDEEAGGPPDLKGLLAARGGAGRHYYACGPSVMLDNFVATCEALGYAEAHIERFAAVEHKPADDAKKTFTVELKRSGRVIEITPDKSVLHTLLDAGVDVDHSCEEGVCGACETKVLEGEPDHRDSVLSAAEHASNKMMMVCVSGCKSARLVLDL
jgi:ferredoxin